jgi:hypothetical protein
MELAMKAAFSAVESGVYPAVSVAKLLFLLRASG